MKQLLTTLAFLLVFQFINGQSIEVTGFKHEPMDLRARRPGVKDINDQNCALLIVAAWNDDVKFSDNNLYKFEKKSGEYWVWFSPNARRVTISAQNYTTLYYDFTNPLKGEEVYLMTLKMERIGDITSANLVNLTFSINQPDTYIAKDNQAGIQAAGATARFMLSPGNHKFKFSKQGFSDITKEYTVKRDTTISVVLVQGTSTTEFKAPSIITVNSNPSGASVYANQQLIGQTPVQKTMEPGTYTLSITKELYQDYTTSIKLESQVPLDIGTIELKSIAAEINVTSNPAGADIYLNNRFLGKSPFKKEINSGKYTLEARFADYRNYTQEIALEKGDKKNFTITLTPAFGELVVDSKPLNGVSVYINGQKVGVTPYRNVKLPSANYEVEVRDETNIWKGSSLWFGSKESVVISDGKKAEKTFVLVQNFGEVSIKSEGADLYLNNEKIGKNALDLKLPPGSYTFTAKLSNHHDATETINLAVAAKQNIDLKPRAILGSISIITNPIESRGAIIEIDGKAIKEKSPAILPLLIGNHSIGVSHPKFIPQTQSVVIRNEGEQKEVVFNLQSYSGSYSQKAKQWRNSKWISLASAVTLNAAGGYFYLKADNTYTEYQKATSTAEAESLREDVGKFETFSNVSFGVSVVPIYMFFHSWVKQKKYEKKMKNY